MENVIEVVRRLLKENVDDKTQQTGQNFFKEKIISHGVKVPTVHLISKQTFAWVKDKSKEEIFSLCEELWKSGYTEESFVACDWSYYIHKKYEPEDIRVFEKWLYRYVNNWASCDTLCNHTIGTFVEMYPAFVSDLKKWAVSSNRWVKRGAAVTLIIPARKGLFLTEIFQIADMLLFDTDDLVRKGYGWMLKAASEAHQQEVFEYVMAKKSVMPRTSLRYAIEKMPAELKKEAMSK